MKRIFNRGNMPAHVASFASQLSGQLAGQQETEFWEASSIDEFEKSASEIGYEIVPAMDMSTKRGYLVGFSVEDVKHITTLVSYAKLKMYFIEVNQSDFDSWVKKINKHREEQQLDSALRKEQNQESKRKLKKQLKIKGE